MAFYRIENFEARPSQAIDTRRGARATVDVVWYYIVMVSNGSVGVRCTPACQKCGFLWNSRLLSQGVSLAKAEVPQQSTRQLSRERETDVARICRIL